MEPIGIVVIGMILVILWYFFGKFSGSEKVEEYKQEKKKVERELEKQRDSKVTCMECGWKNPPENKFCNDCGSELESQV